MEISDVDFLEDEILMGAEFVEGRRLNLKVETPSNDLLISH
jgi:hypothetical protein